VLPPSRQPDDQRCAAHGAVIDPPWLLITIVAIGAGAAFRTDRSLHVG
jgi:hypothetical protein